MHLSYLNKDPLLWLACMHFLEMIVSSCFKKGKNQFWKLLEKFEKFHDCFSNLGLQYEMSEELFKQLEEFVCYLYGMRIKSVNEVRWRLFEKKHKRENKIADLWSLPPCQEVLRYHCQRTNFVPYIWRHSFQPMIQLEDVENHGWFQSGDIFWFEVAFPDDVEYAVFGQRRWRKW